MINVAYNDLDNEDKNSNGNFETENLNDDDEVDDDDNDIVEGEVDSIMNDSDDDEHVDDENDDQKNVPKHTPTDDVHVNDVLASDSNAEHGYNVKDASVKARSGNNDNVENDEYNLHDEGNAEEQQQKQQIRIDSDNSDSTIDRYLRECAAMIRYIKKLENVELVLRVQNEILAREALLNGYRPDHLYDPTIKLPFVSTTSTKNTTLAKKSSNPTAKRKSTDNAPNEKSAVDNDSTPKKVVKRRKKKSLSNEESALLVRVPESLEKHE